MTLKNAREAAGLRISTCGSDAGYLVGEVKWFVKVVAGDLLVGCLDAAGQAVRETSCSAERKLDAVKIIEGLCPL